MLLIKVLFCFSILPSFGRFPSAISSYSALACAYFSLFITSGKLSHFFPNDSRSKKYPEIINFFHIFDSKCLIVCVQRIGDLPALWLDLIIVFRRTERLLKSTFVNCHTKIIRHIIDFNLVL